MNPAQQTFTIQEVSERLDLSKSTLRFWEKEFDSYILPKRTSGGQRRYGNKDVLLLSTISNMKKQGLTLADIKHHLAIQQVNEKGMDTETIEKLAKQIAGAVHREIIRFFQQGA